MAKVSMDPDQPDRIYIDSAADLREFTRTEGCSDISIKDSYLTTETLPFWDNSYVTIWHANTSLR